MNALVFGMTRGECMQSITRGVFLAILLACATSVYVQGNPHTVPTALDPDENLLSPKYFRPVLSHQKTVQPQRNRYAGDCVIKDGTVTLSVGPEKDKSSSWVSFPFDYSTILAEKLLLCMEYSLEGEGAVSFCDKNFPLAPIEKGSFEIAVSVAADSTDASVTFSCNKPQSRLVLQNISVMPVRYATALGKPLLLGNTQVESICYRKTNVKDTFFDKRAADMLQKHLYFAGAGVLPIAEIDAGIKPENAIIIGQAAKQFIPEEILTSIGAGGYAFRVTGNIAAVYGRHPSGNNAGVFAFLKKLGFYCLTTNEYIAPTVEKLSLSDMTEQSNPAIPMRLDTWPAGNSIKLGMSDPSYMVDMYPFGRRYCPHSLPYIDRKSVV